MEKDVDKDKGERRPSTDDVIPPWDPKRVVEREDRSRPPAPRKPKDPR